MQFDKHQAEQASEADQEILDRLAAKLNERKLQLARQGWKGDGIYQWLCLVAGRWIRRFRNHGPNDPEWMVIGWGIGRSKQGPIIYFDITSDTVRVDRREGYKAWMNENRISNG